MSAPAPPEQQPLSISWREWIARAPWSGNAWTGPAHDAIVVGSGYGGSVAALRLAQKGYRVLLLERGSEFLPGEFPNDFALVPKFFRINLPTEGLPLGRASGLVEVTLGQGLVAVTGNGLGGGSLINAGVLMKPDPDVFAQDRWPAAIRHGVESPLEPFFDQAQEHLGARSWDSALPGGGRLFKTLALERLGRALDGRVTGVTLTVDPERCVRCGDCAAGCNVPGAKRTLASTYLAAAMATGRVQIVTQAEVYRFLPDATDCGDHCGWGVEVFSTDAQHQFTSTREVCGDSRPAATLRTVRAPMLFICAGALGSTQLLQRSQSQAGGPLAFSPALGTRVSGNGDSLSWVIDEEEPVGALGRGARGVEAWHQAVRREPHAPTDIAGPTITAAIDLRGGGKPLEQRVVIEDGAIPRAVAQLYRELLASVTTLRALDGWWLPRASHAGAAEEDPLAASDRRAQQSQLLLAMGHDGSPARMVWLEGSDRSAPYLPQPGKLATYAAQQELFDRLGRRHVHSPLWQALPASASELMSGPKPEQTVTTVHPLGGCVMSDHPRHGVVNDRGQVWVADPGRGFIGSDALDIPGWPPERDAHANEARLYKGLYVLDGAIVPTSLGCNPLWTITALAERALDAIPNKAEPQEPAQVLRGDCRAPAPLPSADVAIDARLHEVLMATAFPLHGRLGKALGATAAGRFEATFLTPDLPQAMRTARHAMAASASLYLGKVGEDQETRLHYASQDGAGFEPLPAASTSSGAALFWRSLAELVLLLATAFGTVITLFIDWRAAAVAALAFAVLAVLLPFARTLWTWLILRGWRDLRENRKDFRWSALPAWTLALLKQLVHASEKRVMRYRIPLALQPTPKPPDGAPVTLMLHATKTVMYRAAIGEFLAWLWRRGRGVLRPTLWEQVMNARMRVVTGRRPAWARPVLATTFRMGFDNLTSSGLSSGRQQAGGVLELGRRGDSTSGTLALASYPLLFLRFALKTRLLDFRLPTYSNLPVPDRAPADETRLRMEGGDVEAELHWIQVERGSSSSDRGEEDTGPLRLPLWRYRRRDADGRPLPPELVTGSWMGRPVVRAKSVLLLHAFGQSGLSYTLKTVDRNLAEHLYAAGHEVWILETRMSTRSGHAGQPCTVDQIGRHDIPGAFEHILKALQTETGALLPLQIGAFAQCIGSAALWMALLSGRLSHGNPARDSVFGEGPELSMLSHLVSSQVHPWIVGARGTQSKTWMPALLQAVWRRGVIPFAVRGPQEGVLLPLLDRVFGSMPAPAGEDRRPQGHDDAAATCRRIRYIEAPLFQHRNINDATFGAMNLLFGDANLRLFAQARRFVDRERLVDEDGSDRYVTEANLRRHAAFPVQLLHGADNELFDASSARRSFRLLGELHRGWQEQFCEGTERQVGPLLVKGYGHLDVLIGQAAEREVYPAIAAFFQRCLDVRDHVAEERRSTGWIARSPRLGPFVGWRRTERGTQRVRISFVIDDRNGQPDRRAPPPIRVRFRLPGQAGWTGVNGTIWQVLPVGTHAGHRAPLAHRLAWADIALPPAASQAVDWQVLTLHPTRMPVTRGATAMPDANPSDAQLDAFLASMGENADHNPVQPPLSDGGHDFSFVRARFRLPVPPPADTREAVPFAVACCRHPGFGLDQRRVDLLVGELLKRERAQPLDFAMLLGDQIYADASAGLLDPTSPLERYYERHELAFARPGLGDLLASLPVYMTPDDHEWAEAFPCGSPLVREPWPDWNRSSGFYRRQQRAFRVASSAIGAFQRLQTPAGTGSQPYYGFQQDWVRVFVLDTRHARKRGEEVVVNRRSFERLRHWLAQPAAAHCLNVVASGSVVLPGLRGSADPANPGIPDSWQYAPQQRLQLLELLTADPRRRFLLLSGDYHVSGALLVQRDGRTAGAAVLAPPLYAPMPYANTAPEAVATGEELVLQGGEVLRLEQPAGGEVARGSGLGVLDVRRRDGGFRIGYRRDLWVWESGAGASHEATLDL